MGALAVAGAVHAAPPDPLAAGRAVYNFRCYYCHGYSGDAKTLAATFVSPPPTDFTRADPARLTPAHIRETLRQGRPGTAMKSFARVISAREIEDVARFVHEAFVRDKAVNTRYHTPENGWPGHERYRAAYPFATGEIPLSREWESLDPSQAEGKRLYLSACVSCHDRGAPGDDGVAWDARPLSYPRNGFSLANPPPGVDALAGASPYARHDVVPRLRGLSAAEKRGERLFQANCAFCHGADGSGRNWIGAFLEPHPRDLRDAGFMVGMTRERLARTIAEGLPDTSMPAWRDVLKPAEIDAIVDYVARAFHPLPPRMAARTGAAAR
ncbi:MAG: c-type cytochrome [Rhodocyclaceae bacterium]|nr:c-type cytochrome [Rhodocyclaceae bacterium]